jgi:threonine synthase
MLERCPDCLGAGRPETVDPVYAYDAEGRRALAAGAGRWTYHRMLPVTSEQSVVTLGEGDTPLLPLPAVRDETGAGEV